MNAATGRLLSDSISLPTIAGAAIHSDVNKCRFHCNSLDLVHRRTNRGGGTPALNNVYLDEEQAACHLLKIAVIALSRPNRRGPSEISPPNVEGTEYFCEYARHNFRP